MSDFSAEFWDSSIASGAICGIIGIMRREQDSDRAMVKTVLHQYMIMGRGSLPRSHRVRTCFDELQLGPRKKFVTQDSEREMPSLSNGTSEQTKAAIQWQMNRQIETYLGLKPEKMTDAWKKFGEKHWLEIANHRANNSH